MADRMPYGQSLHCISNMIGGGVSLPYDHPDVIGGDEEKRKHDIGEILHQIMAITDESLDEAQARLLCLIF